jgi:hypothetical protein
MKRDDRLESKLLEYFFVLLAEEANYYTFSDSLKQLALKFWKEDDKNIKRTSHLLGLKARGS